MWTDPVWFIYVLDDWICTVNFAKLKESLPLPHSTRIPC